MWDLIVWFVNSWDSWFVRSSSYYNGSDTGAFAFGHANGPISLSGSFRGTFAVLLRNKKYKLLFK